MQKKRETATSGSGEIFQTNGQTDTRTNGQGYFIGPCFTS